MSSAFAMGDPRGGAWARQEMHEMRRNLRRAFHEAAAMGMAAWEEHGRRGPGEHHGHRYHAPDEHAEGAPGERRHRGPRGRGPWGPGGGFGFGPGPNFPFGPRGFGRGRKAKRGDVRAAILALLAEEPRNGYQI